MALTLSHIEQLRSNVAQALHSLEAFRIDARNRFLRALHRPLDSHERKLEQAEIRRHATASIIDLEAQRRRVVRDHERDVQLLEARLLLLLHRYEQLTIDDGR